jgi:hypothetical protein
MLVCYCGNILVSDGVTWSCPYIGDKTMLYGNDKQIHVGTKKTDMRVQNRSRLSKD